MNEMYNTIEVLCKQRGVNITEMCRGANVPRGNLTDLKYGRTAELATKSLRKIADYFGVTIEYLLGTEKESPIINCDECGFSYNASEPEQIALHKKRHATWENAVKKFGFCWTHRYREEAKAEARYKIAQTPIDDDQYIDAQLTIFKALFSRSLEGCDYSLKHVSFNDYVAMMLNQEQWKSEIPPHIYMKMSGKYGVKDGIATGSYYNIEKAPVPSDERKIEDPDIRMIARAGRKMTPEQRENLRKYAQYMFPEAFKDDNT